MSLNAVLSERLKKARQKKGYTQAELAEMCECKQTAISNAENGRSVPEIYNLIRIAQALDVSLDWLCGMNSSGDGSREITPNQWLAFLDKLIENPPIYMEKIGLHGSSFRLHAPDGTIRPMMPSGSPMIELSKTSQDGEEEAAALVFRHPPMAEFFTAYIALSALKKQLTPDMFEAVKQGMLNKSAGLFSPGIICEVEKKK